MRLRLHLRAATCLCVLLGVSPVCFTFQTKTPSKLQQSDLKQEPSAIPKSPPNTSAVATKPETQSANQEPCKVGWWHCFCQHLKSGDPPAFSAVGTICGAFFTLLIGFVALSLNRNIRKGQVAHDQIRMLLEIDAELIRCPELWAVHGKTFIPVDAGQITPEKAAAQPATPAETAEAADVHREQAQLETQKQEGKKTTQELRRLALVLQYLNMFDFVYVSFGRRWLYGQDKENWEAWEEYISDFFRDNKFARDAWDEFSAKGIYSTSFRNFLNKTIS